MLATPPAPSRTTLASPDLDYEFFEGRVLLKFGIDLRAYKSDQMRRRMMLLMQRHQIAQFAAYARLLETSAEAADEFKNFFTINVSEFFRDSDKFRDLEQHILPELLATRPQLRVWSAGCSFGAEPYTLALILKKLAPHASHYIQATDIDDTILARAKAGNTFVDADLRNVPAEFRRSFSPAASGQFEIAPEIRQLVHFQRNDLLRGPVVGQFDLILCRNVVIYFVDEAKLDIFRRFHQALRPGGVLFVGATEAVPQMPDHPFHCRYLSFYQKPERQEQP
jgi:chemotaxis protein methyltransferase CheR